MHNATSLFNNLISYSIGITYKNNIFKAYKILFFSYNEIVKRQSK